MRSGAPLRPETKPHVEAELKLLTTRMRAIKLVLNRELDQAADGDIEQRSMHSEGAKVNEAAAAEHVAENATRKDADDKLALALPDGPAADKKSNEQNANTEEKKDDKTEEGTEQPPKLDTAKEDTKKEGDKHPPKPDTEKEGPQDRAWLRVLCCAAYRGAQQSRYDQTHAPAATAMLSSCIVLLVFVYWSS